MSAGIGSFQQFSDPFWFVSFCEALGFELRPEPYIPSLQSLEPSAVRLQSSEGPYVA